MAYDFRQVVHALLGFIVFIMPVLMTLAVPLVLGATSFSSEEKLHLSDSLLDKINAYFYRILEIMPDVDKEALLHDIGDILSKREDASLDHVFDILFDMLGADGDTAVVKQTEDDNQNVECACCFSAFPFEEMVQCPETHLFCSPCMNMHASILLGSHNPDIRCVDQSGCTLPISTSELQRLLSPKMMELWERAQSRRALESARLENLHYCPFCDWACIIEGDLSGTLICRNKLVCGRSSCLRCKKLDHRPNFCDDQLEGKHHVDEAMSGALVRQCPGCKKPFIKEAGCNRMKCLTCGTESCYICRKSVSGYSHFDRNINSGDTGPVKSSRLCPLWDNKIEERHDMEVKLAAERAHQEYYQRTGASSSTPITVGFRR